MSDLERRRSRTPRKQREARAYRLVLATGGFSLIGAIGVVLAVVGATSLFGWPLLAILLAVGSGFWLKSTLGS